MRVLSKIQILGWGLLLFCIFLGVSLMGLVIAEEITGKEYDIWKIIIGILLLLLFFPMIFTRIEAAKECKREELFDKK